MFPLQTAISTTTRPKSDGGLFVIFGSRRVPLEHKEWYGVENKTVVDEVYITLIFFLQLGFQRAREK